VIPQAIAIEIPPFSSVAPTYDLVTPTNSFAFFEGMYTSIALDALQGKLLSDLTAGGYGIEIADESALWARAREREIEAGLADDEALITAAAGRGCALPPGDLTVVLQKGQQDMLNKVSSLSRDIALKRADMYVENRKFTIEQVRQVEQILIGYNSSVMERSLNAAKAVMDVAIKLYDTQVAGFNARLEAYKADTSVFGERVRAAMIGVELYKGQIEGARLQVDVQRAMVEVYNAQLKGVDSVIGLYKSQLEAANVQVGIQRLRIEAFQGQVSAYGEQVRAKVAEFNLFEAQIKGEVAKVQAYEAEVRGYTATVDGAKAKSEILIARLRSQVDKAQQGVQAFNAQAEMYRTNITTQAQGVDANVRVYGAQVTGASAKVGAIAQAISLDRTERDLEFKRNATNADLAIKFAAETLKGLIASLNARVQINVAAIDAYKGQVTAALSSVNALASDIKQE
jgi:hypothetical protein